MQQINMKKVSIIYKLNKLVSFNIFLKKIINQIFNNLIILIIYWNFVNFNLKSYYLYLCQYIYYNKYF